MPSHHACQPAPLVGDRQVPASHQLGLDRAQLGLQPLLVRDALELETPVPCFAQMCVKPRNRKRLGSPLAARCPVSGGEPPELDQARLLGGQLQVEPREPFAKITEEPLSVATMLKAHHEVVSEIAPGAQTITSTPPTLAALASPTPVRPAS